MSKGASHASDLEQRLKNNGVTAVSLTGVTLASPTLTAPTITDAIYAGTAVDTTFVITGSSDATKKIRFEVDGVTTATTRVITPPDENFTIVGVGTTQTLTAKTLTAPAISDPVLSGSATGTYTLAGTPTITAPAISAPVLSGSATGTYTLAGTPTITAPAISTPTITGAMQRGAAAGAAGGVTDLTVLKTIANNTAVDAITVTVPNAICSAALMVTAMSGLGDGDSTETKSILVSFSRITGAAAKGTAGTAFGTATITGATGDAVLTIAVSSVAGAVGAANTFTITVKNARSAGSADNHPTVVSATLLNGKASGVTMAAA